MLRLIAINSGISAKKLSFDFSLDNNYLPVLFSHVLWFLGNISPLHFTNRNACTLLGGENSELPLAVNPL